MAWYGMVWLGQQFTEAEAVNIVLKQQANSASSSASSAVVVGEAGYTCIYCGSPLENEVRDRLVLWLSTSTHLFSSP